jgi:hypothetical protein
MSNREAIIWRCFYGIWACKTRRFDNANTENTTVICLADNNYAIPLGVMLYSLAENLKEGKAFIYVIDGGITNANKKR